MEVDRLARGGQICNDSLNRVNLLVPSSDDWLAVNLR